MIVTRWIAARIGAIVLFAVLLQVAFLSYFSVFGTTPDVVPVAIAAVGLLGGGVAGAVVGFAAGMVLDVSLLETLGVSSLVLLSVGYLAGRYRESFEIENLTAPAYVTGVLSMLAAAGYTALQVTLGVDTTVSASVIGGILMSGVLGFVLTFPVYPVVRILLRPALVLEPPASGRTLFGRRGRSSRRRASRSERRRSERRRPNVTRSVA